MKVMKKMILTAVCAALLPALVACGGRAEKAEGLKADGPPKPTATPAESARAAGVDRNQIRAQAEELSGAFVAGDFAKVADLTYAGIVEAGGGKEEMTAFLENGIGEMRAQGFQILTLTVGEPREPVAVGGHVFAVVPTKMRMKTPQGVASKESFFIGVSEDGGKSWTFVDGEGANKERLRGLFPSAPEVADRLELPTVPPPTLEKAQ